MLHAPTHVWSLKMLSQKMRTKTKVYELGGWRGGEGSEFAVKAERQELKNTENIG